MNYYNLANSLYYMLLAVSLLLILQILYNNLVTYKKKLSDNLSVMLISCLVMCIFDVFWSSFEGKAGEEVCQYIGAIGYALSLLIFLIRFNRYFFEKLNIHHTSKTFDFVVYELPSIILALLFVTTPWTHIFYSIDESNYTEYMPAFYYVYMPVLFLYAFSVVMVSLYMFFFRYKKNYEEFKVARSMVVFVLMAVGLYFLQELTYGDLGEEYLSMTVAFSTPLVFLTTDLSVYSHVRQEAKNAAIAADLNTAAKIQLDVLPVKYPAFAEHPCVNLMALMKTAKEVGGDFYDYFSIDDHRVCFLIADVSGKGIPASLCMMTAKTMIKDYAGICENTSDIFTMTNKKFCEQNKTGMFVTAWIGILDTETMVLQYTNAGHNYPMFSKAGGHFEIIKVTHGFFIGGMDGVKYKQAEIQLNPGDRLFLYTDGITEAHNMENKLYGNDRLADSLDRLGNNLKPDDMLKIIADVGEFAGGAPQFDDMTMLMVEIV